MVKFINSANPACSWAGYTHQQNCDFLTAALNAGGTYYRKIVFTTPKFWQSYFGNTCSNIALTSGAQLIYVHYAPNGQINPAPINSLNFGGWSAANNNIRGQQTAGSQFVLINNGPQSAKVDFYQIL